MNIEALIQLKRVLHESIAKTIVYDGNVVEFNMETFCDVNECGTAACAAGSAALDPWFNSQGFLMYNRGLLPYVEVEGIQLFGFKACQHFFGLSYNIVLYLFEPGRYPAGLVTQTQVIERIDKLLESMKEQ